MFPEFGLRSEIRLSAFESQGLSGAIFLSNRSSTLLQWMHVGVVLFVRGEIIYGRWTDFLAASRHYCDYRLRLDHYSEDMGDEAKRLMDMGAKMLQPAEEGKDYMTLADPDGNPFNVVQVPNGLLSANSCGKQFLQSASCCSWKQSSGLGKHAQ